MADGTTPGITAPGTIVLSTITAGTADGTIPGSTILGSMIPGTMAAGMPVGTADGMADGTVDGTTAIMAGPMSLTGAASVSAAETGHTGPGSAPPVPRPGAE